MTQPEPLGIYDPFRVDSALTQSSAVLASGQHDAITLQQQAPWNDLAPVTWVHAGVPAALVQGAELGTKAPAPRRGQALSRTALAVGLVASVGLGFSVFSALASIDVVSLDPLGTFLRWTTWAAIALVAAFAAGVLALVAIFYSRPRRVAAVALVTCIVLPSLSFAVGLQQGASALYHDVQAQVEEGGTAILDSLESSAASFGIDISALEAWLVG